MTMSMKGNFRKPAQIATLKKISPKLLILDLFDHVETGYELIGKHQVVDCRDCHQSRMIDPTCP